MTKTIEEAAKTYVESADTWSYGCEENHDITEQMCESFKAGANHVYGLPLTSRLTAEEKERVRNAYVAARDGYWDECNDMNIAVESVLEHIFGSDFFKEGE